METPRVIKFRNGDLVIAVVRETENDGAIWLQNPILVAPYPVMDGDMIGETFLLKPWIGITEDKDFLIRKADILATCTLRDSLMEQYRKYVAGPQRRDEPEDNYDLEIETITAAILRDKNLLN